MSSVAAHQAMQMFFNDFLNCELVNHSEEGRKLTLTFQRSDRTAEHVVDITKVPQMIALLESVEGDHPHQENNLRILRAEY